MNLQAFLHVHVTHTQSTFNSKAYLSYSKKKSHKDLVVKILHPFKNGFLSNQKSVLECSQCAKTKGMPISQSGPLIASPGVKSLISLRNTIVHSCFKQRYVYVFLAVTYTVMCTVTGASKFRMPCTLTNCPESHGCSHHIMLSKSLE